jgi:hypothetical protein
MPLYDSNGFRVDTIPGKHSLRVEENPDGEGIGYVWDAEMHTGFWVHYLFATELAALEHCLARLQLESARVNKDIDRIGKRIVDLMCADDKEPRS